MKKTAKLPTARATNLPTARAKPRAPRRSRAHVAERRGPMSFRAIIRLWPDKAAMAADLGVKLSRVEKWYVRDAIPPEFWVKLIQVADTKRLDIIYQDLAALAAVNAVPDDERLVAA